MTKNTKKSWRDIYPVHPAADAIPMMSEEELKDLGEDIKKNGLKLPIFLWSEVSGFYRDPEKDKEVSPERRQEYVLAGRNRLDAMELVGDSGSRQVRPRRLPRREAYEGQARERQANQLWLVPRRRRRKR